MITLELISLDFLLLRELMLFYFFLLFSFDIENKILHNSSKINVDVVAIIYGLVSIPCGVLKHTINIVFIFAFLFYFVCFHVFSPLIKFPFLKLCWFCLLLLLCNIHNCYGFVNDDCGLVDCGEGYNLYFQMMLKVLS